jgi:hypothetical protein
LRVGQLEHTLQVLKAIQVGWAFWDAPRREFLGVPLARLAMRHPNLIAALQALGDLGQAERADLRLDRADLDLGR